MKIKATSINNLTDARYFAAWNVEWLGFSLEIGSPNYTRPQDVKEIKDWLVGPKIVGEFGLDQSLTEIQEAVKLLQLEGVQLSMYADLSLAEQLQEVTVIKEWVLDDLTNMDGFVEHCTIAANQVDYFYLDLEKNNISWADLQANSTALKSLQELCTEYAVLISLVCPPEQIEAYLDSVKPHGISLQGGEEEKVGVKSFDDLDAIFETLDDLDLIY
ncbi:MAG: Phosphoribosylanthranilate isomerase (EC [uncultured Aureispira sp.]|uniref:Phosphoribosylanthranilate isomerase (EC) n=1 Tax=uncultured Aureispira sp. TaxID=1331704 RepID=A0A6S6RU38_9BACT|nr:MAG: Phosphoribosylanthranilate isomerase (EC [uncultured Aureispira sp.]